MGACTQRLLLGAAMTALLVAACSSEPQVAAEVLPATEVPSPTTLPAPTATPQPATPTATAAPEPTAAPTATPEPQPTLPAGTHPESDELFDIHHRFMTELLAQDESTDAGVGEFLQLARELTIGEAEQSLRDRLRVRQAAGEHIISPGYESHATRAVQLVDGRVQVFDCSRDQAVLYDSSGAVLAESVGDWKIRSTVLTKDDGSWKVMQFRANGESECTP